MLNKGQHGGHSEEVLGWNTLMCRKDGNKLNAFSVSLFLRENLDPEAGPVCEPLCSLLILPFDGLHGTLLCIISHVLLLADVRRSFLEDLLHSRGQVVHLPLVFSQSHLEGLEGWARDGEIEWERKRECVIHFVTWRPSFLCSSRIISQKYLVFGSTRFKLLSTAISTLQIHAFNTLSIFVYQWIHHICLFLSVCMWGSTKTNHPLVTFRCKMNYKSTFHHEIQIKQ